MTRYDPEAFAALTDFAHTTISQQNASYETVGNFSVPESAVNAQNRIAAQQTEHLGVLGELSDELPYEQLVRDALELEREAEATKSQLGTVDDYLCTGKLGVMALGNRIMELMPGMEPMATRRISERTAEITAEQREILTDRLAGLTEDLGSLSVICEVALRPWPLPRAFAIEVESLPKDRKQNGVLDPLDILELDIMPVEPGLAERASIDGLRSMREWRVDEPNASRYIALYFIEHANTVVTVDALIDFVYDNCKDEIEDKNNLRSRITTILGPQIQGLRMARLLAEEGYALQYGWKKLVRRDSDGTEKQACPRRRIYKAVPIDETSDKLPEFIDKEYVDAEESAIKEFAI